MSRRVLVIVELCLREPGTHCDDCGRYGAERPGLGTCELFGEPVRDHVRLPECVRAERTHAEMAALLGT